MISLICFLLTLAGSINWFCIGVLQYDFVAGLFGSQANVFSRIIYALIGLSSIWLVFAVIKGKGKLKIDGKKSTDKQLLSKKKATAYNETSESYNPNMSNQNYNDNHTPNNFNDNNYNHNDYNNDNYNTNSQNSFNGFNNPPYNNNMPRDYREYNHRNPRNDNYNNDYHN